MTYYLNEVISVAKLVRKSRTYFYSKKDSS